MVLVSVFITVVLGIVAILIVGTCALFAVAVALILCIAPIALMVEGIKQIVSLTRDLYELKKKKKDVTNNYKEQLKQIEEAYKEKRERINNTIESIENSTSIVKDELGEEVVVQELVPITLEDMELYNQYIAQFNSVDAQAIGLDLVMINDNRKRLNEINNRELREELEHKCTNRMFNAQDIISQHIKEINSMNTSFDKDTKKRRLFRKSL